MVFGLPTPPSVWAVDDTSVQIVWGDLADGPIRVAVVGTDNSLVVDHNAGPGSILLDDLAPATRFEIEISHSHGSTRLEAETLRRPAGRELCRVATISDLHLGATSWGLLRTMSEDPDRFDQPHPWRCAHSALVDAENWGADFVVVKGDAVHHETPEAFEQLGRLVDLFPNIPMMLMPGNHDVDGNGRADACGQVIPTCVGGRNLPFVRSSESVDLPGVRLIGADTTVPGRGPGSLRRVADEIFDRACGSDRPVLVATHHQLQPGRMVRHWPPGIAAPDSTRLLDRLAQLPLPVIATSGHTHRNRARHHDSILLTEVASTKDWPGVWAGYKVFEGGIIQTVRRVSSPSAMAWTEYSRHALGGVWGLWAPGPMNERCLHHSWLGDSNLVVKPVR